MKTNPHKTEGLARPCHPGDLFIVSEGVQCGNCLALVIDHRTDENETSHHEDTDTAGQPE